MKTEAIDDALTTAKEYKIKNILAVSGDKDEKDTNENADNAINYSLDLMKYINANYQNDFESIVVAGYPEGHPSKRKLILNKDWNPIKNKPKYHAVQVVNDQYIGVSDKDWKEEFKILKEKIKNGAKLIITQFFYNKHIFIDFIKEAKKRGITTPILCGIMPIRTYKSFKRWTDLCKTMIPKDLKQNIEQYANDKDKLYEYGLEYVAKMSADLINEHVVPGIHIYTMNNEKITIALLKKLNVLCTDSLSFNNEYIQLDEEKQQYPKIKEIEETIHEKKKSNDKLKIMIFSTVISIAARRLYRSFA